MTEIFPLHVVVRFYEDLSQDGLANRIVLGIEFIKTMESVSVLKMKQKTNGDTTATSHGKYQWAFAGWRENKKTEKNSERHKIVVFVTLYAGNILHFESNVLS